MGRPPNQTFSDVTADQMYGVATNRQSDRELRGIETMMGWRIGQCRGGLRTAPTFGWNVAGGAYVVVYVCDPRRRAEHPSALQGTPAHTLRDGVCATRALTNR